MNHTVYFNPEWIEALNLLDEDDRNAVISGIVTYQITGTVSDRVGSMAAFVLLRIEVDRRNRRIERARQKRNQHNTAQSDPASTGAGDNPAPHSQPSESARRTAASPHSSTSPLPSPPSSPGAGSSPQQPATSPSRPKRPDLTPEKKAAIASLVQSLLQPRPSSAHTPGH